ncbi:SGNH hydrolase-type esterase domain-containing protein [Coniochaeta sp. 2T2.1]|nr:SGNH hydrolase-type esterase domain-containing protein [Coniochaeta sp. 2T2.1]
MRPLPKFLTAIVTALTLIGGGQTSPLANKTDQIATIKRLLGSDTFEWTALGDSYASGAGAGDYMSDSYRCLRYHNAYPNLINYGSSTRRLPDGQHTFHYAACSGSSTSDVQTYQLVDQDSWRKPNFQYALGNIPHRTCQDQRNVTWDLLNSPKLPNDIDTTVKKIVTKGRKGPVGDKFKLYVTGFPQFFNADTDGCDSVTFARGANPVPSDGGLPHFKMTKGIRAEFNAMSVKLNEAIEEAVSRNKDQGVRWVPIDQELNGHRFCEPGVVEPDQHNPNLWLFHYPYLEVNAKTADDQQADAALQKALENVTARVGDVSKAFKTHTEFIDALFDALPPPPEDSSSHPPATQKGFFDFIWRFIGARIKVFHPQLPLHQRISDMVLDAYINDLKHDNAPPPPPPPPPKSSDAPPPPPPTPPAHEHNACRGVSGEYFVPSRDLAVENAKAFCAQALNKVIYNPGTANELELSARKVDDPSKTTLDAPFCEGGLIGNAIDGCDGGDPVNNPRNKKYGSTFTTPDGWEYKMTPLARQENKVRCDAWYKGLFDTFWINGKNLPDAKLGNGDGLKHEIQGCGALTGWVFEWLGDDEPEWEWRASGRLPIGTKSCVGNALVTAGGADKGNCWGAGR